MDAGAPSDRPGSEPHGTTTKPSPPVHKCWSCRDAFADHTALVNHMRAEHVDKPRACALCPRSFLRQRNLVQHVRAEHGLPDGTVRAACPVCRVTYRHDSTAEHHRKTYGCGKQFTCNACRTSFARDGDLVAHMRLHVNIGVCACAVCGKSYVRPGNLVNHLRLRHGIQVK